MPAAASDVPTFWIGRNPATTSRLPYVLRLPVSGEGRIFLAARETWPRGTDVYCHQIGEWPPEADIVEEVPVEACWRAGAAVHLVLRRARQRRSLFVWTRKGERTLVFWRSEASMRRARPGIRVPLARDFGERLTVAVDSGERYPWRFAGRPVTAERRRLPVGDYALVVADEISAAVERKTAQDLASAATGGQLGLTLAELGQTRHAAIVIEGRLSDVIKEADRVRPGWLLSIIAALQVEHPRVAWMFAETRQLAEEWAYRWLAAAARADSPRALPLLDERALGEAPIAYEGRPRLLDATARRSSLLEEATAGAEWTSRSAARRCGVTQVTAAADLAALVREGRLRVTGAGTKRRYVARLS
ncbi:MAG TPA: ERCC4 domain-containing protein [Candidatus Limnocylindria bacterium]|nr:ERCC4 domain-containing protein [Candidatus Limnocylindria bacterium]